MSGLRSRVSRLERGSVDGGTSLALYEIDALTGERSLSAEDARQLERDEKAGKLVVFLRCYGGTPRGRLNSDDAECGDWPDAG